MIRLEEGDMSSRKGVFVSGCLRLRLLSCLYHFVLAAASFSNDISRKAVLFSFHCTWAASPTTDRILQEHIRTPLNLWVMFQ
jgi:hypothetical protein